jgi:heptosyltransferase-3
VHQADRRGGLAENWRLFRSLRRERFDLVLDYSEGDRGALGGLASGAGERIGYRGKKSHIFRNLSHTRLIPDRTLPEALARNISQSHAQALALLGHPVGEIPLPQVCFSPDGEQKAQNFLRQNALEPGQRYVLFHLTTQRIRQWPEKHCLEAINWVNENVGQVLLTGGSDPTELEFVNSLIAEADRPVINAAGALDLDSLSALVNGAALFVGVDSLLGHLAGALGRPTVSVFGPYSAAHFAPRGPQVKVARVDCPRYPCVSSGGPGQGGCRPSGYSGCLEDMSFQTYVRPLIESFCRA